MANPIKNFISVKRDELPLSLLMFGYFFLVISSFWILKPIKKAIFIQYYDESGFVLWGWEMVASQAELLAKVLNMVVAFAAVAAFTWLSRRFQRQQLTYIFTGFFISGFVYYYFNLTNPTELTVWTFYLFGDLYTTIMVATFFAFMNDSVTAEEAKRMYGLVVLGGVVGGVFGTSALRIWIDSMPYADWLWVLTGAALVIVGIAFAAGRLADRRMESVANKQTARDEDREVKKKANAAFEGARLVFKSRYLISIVAIVGLYEIVSTVMDFQFTTTVAHYKDGDAIGEHFSTIYAITNWTSLIIQLFITPYILTRVGVGTALSVLPVVIILASSAFLIVPILWVGSMLNTVDNAFNYSINQSARETLYVPTDRDTKYKAKAFIDMFVMRFAKALAVGVSLLVTSVFATFSSVRWLSLFTLALVAVWLIAVKHAGDKFNDLANDNSSDPAGKDNPGTV